MSVPPGDSLVTFHSVHPRTLGDSNGVDTTAPALNTDTQVEAQYKRRTHSCPSTPGTAGVSNCMDKADLAPIIGTQVKAHRGRSHSCECAELDGTHSAIAGADKVTGKMLASESAVNLLSGESLAAFHSVHPDRTAPAPNTDAQVEASDGAVLSSGAVIDESDVGVQLEESCSWVGAASSRSSSSTRCSFSRSSSTPRTASPSAQQRSLSPPLHVSSDHVTPSKRVLACADRVLPQHYRLHQSSWGSPSPRRGSFPRRGHQSQPLMVETVNIMASAASRRH